MSEAAQPDSCSLAQHRSPPLSSRLSWRSLRAVVLVLTLAHVTHGTKVPDNFAHIGASSDSDLVSWTVGLRIDGHATIAAEIADRSDPTSPRFRAWLQPENVRQLLAPTDAVRSAAVARLSRANATCEHLLTGLRCTALARDVNRLYNVQLHAYDDSSSGAAVRHHRVQPGSSFTLPADGSHHFVAGLVDFPPQRTTSAQKADNGNNGARRLTTDYTISPGESRCLGCDKAHCSAHA